jgi:nucleoside-diphosphate kinase
MIGDTDPLRANPGTIRGDYGLDIEHNLVHGSDSEESAEREISLFFSEKELLA